MGDPQAQELRSRRARVNWAAPARETLVISVFELLQQLFGMPSLVSGSWTCSTLSQGQLSHCPTVPGLGSGPPHCWAERVSREGRSKHEHPTNLMPRSLSRKKNGRNTMEPMDSITMNHPGQTGSQKPLSFLSLVLGCSNLYLRSNYFDL